jgi:hypothetical protein
MSSPLHRILSSHFSPATEKAWLTKFAGSSHLRLISKIKAIADNREPADIEKMVPKGVYTNILPIVQSSGMGKSRTVDEIAKGLFTIPICLRDQNDSGLCPSVPCTSL